MILSLPSSALQADTTFCMGFSSLLLNLIGPGLLIVSGMLSQASFMATSMKLRRC